MSNYFSFISCIFLWYQDVLSRYKDITSLWSTSLHHIHMSLYVNGPLFTTTHVLYVFVHTCMFHDLNISFQERFITKPKSFSYATLYTVHTHSLDYSSNTCTYTSFKFMSILLLITTRNWFVLCWNEFIEGISPITNWIFRVHGSFSYNPNHWNRN